MDAVFEDNASPDIRGGMMDEEGEVSEDWPMPKFIDRLTSEARKKKAARIASAIEAASGAPTSSRDVLVDEVRRRRRTKAVEKAEEIGGVKYHAMHPWRPKFSCGLVEYSLPNPIFDDELREKTLKNVWTQYYRYAGTSMIEWSNIFSLITTWKATKSAGRFWDEGWGPPLQVLLHAFQLIWVFRDEISYDYECPDARIWIRDVMGEIFDGNRPFDLSIDELEGSFGISYTHDNLCPEFFVLFGEKQVGGEWNNANKRLTLNVNHLEPLSELVDVLLFHAGKIVAGYNAGLVDSTYDAAFAGGMAMGAILWLAKEIMHELIHAYYRGRSFLGHLIGDDHYLYDCCFYSIPLRWVCRVASLLGAYPADPESGIAMNEMAGKFVSGGGGFDGSCSLWYPGIPSSSIAYTLGSSSCNYSGWL